jgi:hypothetical protein
MGWVVNATPRPLYPREKSGTHRLGGWVGPRTGLEGVENLAPTGVRSPDLPARSKSLYRLSYPGLPIRSTKWKYKGNHNHLIRVIVILYFVDRASWGNSGFTANLTHFFHFFRCIYFSASTCFKRQALIIRREQLYQYILWYNTLARW